MRHAAIIGTGSYVPETRMTNDDLSKLVDTSDEWIYSRTGIKERRISSNENTSDLAFHAAESALNNAGLDPKELDLIIVATITPDSFMPSVACMVQAKLGAERAVAFDLTAACTGLIYGLVTAERFISSGMYKNALVIGAETLSKVLDWEDRSTCVLFGDGAGAVVLSATEDMKGILAAKLLSDGSKQHYLTCKALPVANPYVTPDTSSIRSVIQMEGQEVFKFAVRTITENIKGILTESGLNSEEVRFIIPHQANFRIIDQAAKYCNVAVDKFFMNLESYGNTSAASIGIALDELLQSGKVQAGDKLILVGFGGGLTSGAILVEL